MERSPDEDLNLENIDKNMSIIPAMEVVVDSNTESRFPDEYMFKYKNLNRNKEATDVPTDEPDALKHITEFDEIDVDIFGCLSQNTEQIIDSITGINQKLNSPLFRAHLVIERLINDGLIKQTTECKEKMTKVTVLGQLCTRFVKSLCDALYIDTKYVSKLMVLCSHLMRYEDECIFTNICNIYLHIIKINGDSNIFDNDLVLNGNKYLKQHDKIRNDVLLNGYLRRFSEIIIIPVDVQNVIFRYMACGIELNLFNNLAHLANIYPDSAMYKIIFEERLTKWVQGCDDDDNEVHSTKKFQSIQNIRRLLSITNPPTQQIVDSGVVPKLIEFLQFDDDEKLQFETAWVLTNICAGTTEQILPIIENGAIPLLMSLLESPSMEVKEQCLWAIGNIAGDSVETRNLILRSDVLDYILPICKNSASSEKNASSSLLKNVSWILSNFCRGAPSPNYEYMTQIMECMSYLINVDDLGLVMTACTDKEILSNFGWACSYLTGNADADDQTIDADLLMHDMMQFNWMRILIDLIDHKSEHVRQPSVRAIGNIIATTDNYTDYIIAQGVLSKLYNVFIRVMNQQKSNQNQNKNRNSFKREICWMISNITAGTSQQIGEVLKLDIFSSLIHTLNNESYDVAKEALWAITNATSGGTKQQISDLVDLNVIPAVCSFLNKTSSTKLLLVTLECIENILSVGKQIGKWFKYTIDIEENGGLQCLQEIAANDDSANEIYEKVQIILEQHWSTKT